MAIASVKVNINGQEYNLAYVSSTGKWRAEFNAPSATSFNQPGGYYNPVVTATNEAGTSGSANADTIETLKFVVHERVAPVITILSPSMGATVTNNKQPVVFTVVDEAGGSGVDLDSIVVKLDGSPVSAGEITHSAITNGYQFTYTPASAVGDGSHTVTVDAADNDGNDAAQKSTQYKVDTTPPSHNVTLPVEGYVSAESTVQYAGITNDATSSPVTVSITLNGLPQASPSVGSDGAYSGAFAELDDGDYTAIFTATDSAGKSSSVTRHFTVDTSVPQIVSAVITPNPADAGATVVIEVVVQ